MSALPTPRTIDEAYDAVYVRTDNMAPDVPRGSIAFIEPPGYRGEGIYSVPYGGQHVGDLRRIYWFGSGFRLQIDNWPKDDEPTLVSREDLTNLGVRRVAGVAKAFTNE